MKVISIKVDVELWKKVKKKCIDLELPLYKAVDQALKLQTVRRNVEHE